MAKKNRQLRGAAFMDALDARLQALTPEDMLDTSEEDAERGENFKMADGLHQAELERGDKNAIELERMSKEVSKKLPIENEKPAGRVRDNF
jgi:hypothetical protein